MENKFFQNIVLEMTDVIDKTFGILDELGGVIASSNINLISENLDTIKSIFENVTLKLTATPNGEMYTVFVDGDDILSEKYAAMLTVLLSNLNPQKEDIYDKAHYIKDVVFDNILPGDVYIKAHELGIDFDASRVAIIISASDKNDISVYEILKNIFFENEEDYLVHIDDTDVALIKSVNGGTYEDVENLARSVKETLEAEFFINVNIGIGTIVNNIKNISKSFKEASTALEIGKVFESEKIMFSYENLGIARLIYQLPSTLCENFLKETFKRGDIESLDEETLFTVSEFFKNNLNISETARSLFIHRNTLVYRIEKIKKITGLDLREFDSATTFKIALMVNKYLKNKPLNY